MNRFYAGEPTWGDRLRILSGRPPIPVGKALASLFGGPRSGVARLSGGNP